MNDMGYETMSIGKYLLTEHHVPEDIKLHQHCCENLKFGIMLSLFVMNWYGCGSNQQWLILSKTCYCWIRVRELNKTTEIIITIAYLGPCIRTWYLTTILQLLVPKFRNRN